VYEGEVTELTPEETENPLGGYGASPPSRPPFLLPSLPPSFLLPP
jgi:hypothetical protein